MNRITILVDDHMVFIDGKGHHVDCSKLEGVHAVQWYDDHGVIEHKQKGNFEFTQLHVVQEEIDKWIAAEASEKERLDLAARPSWDKVRVKRNRLLSECDWTHLGDIPTSTTKKWTKYRQALRDITKKFKSPENVVWPDPPED